MFKWNTHLKTPKRCLCLIKYKHVLITGTINFYISVYRSHTVIL